MPLSAANMSTDVSSGQKTAQASPVAVLCAYQAGRPRNRQLVRRCGCYFSHFLTTTKKNDMSKFKGRRLYFNSEPQNVQPVMLRKFDQLASWGHVSIEAVWNSNRHSPGHF